MQHNRFEPSFSPQISSTKSDNFCNFSYSVRKAADENEGLFIQPMKPKAITVDIRNKSDFKLGSLPDSINIPLNGAFDPDTGELLIKTDALESARNKKSKVLCIIGSSTQSEDAKVFAENLLKLNFYRVCYLHNGIEIFRALKNILCVPNV